MHLKQVFEDVPAVYDFWKWLSPHIDENFTGMCVCRVHDGELRWGMMLILKSLSGYGSSGPVHVIKMERDARDPKKVDIRYKYWWQSKEWLPRDQSLKIFKNIDDIDWRNPSISPAKFSPGSHTHKHMMHICLTSVVTSNHTPENGKESCVANMKCIFKFLRKRVQAGLATEAGSFFFFVFCLVGVNIMACL